MTHGAICSPTRRCGRAQEKLFSPVLALREIRKREGCASDGVSGVELRIERLDAADKLAERFLESQLVDSRRAERGTEEELVFGQSGEFRNERCKIRVAIGPAKSHFNRAAEG